MATSAAGGGPGPGPFGSFKSVQAPVKQPMVALGVLAGAGLIYAFWDMRIRAARKLGHTPKSLTEKDWRDAEHERLTHMPFESNPHKFAYLNPLSHDIPPSRAIIIE